MCQNLKTPNLHHAGPALGLLYYVVLSRRERHVLSPEPRALWSKRAGGCNGYGGRARRSLQPKVKRTCCQLIKAEGTIFKLL